MTLVWSVDMGQLARGSRYRFVTNTRSRDGFLGDFLERDARFYPPLYRPG